MKILLLLILLAYETSSGHSGKFQILHKWKSLEFEFPDIGTKEKMIRQKEYIPENIVPIDVDTWQNGNDNRIFLTIPKFKRGIPASLVEISPRSAGESHLVKPYPDWSFHTPGICESTITSVFRTQIDKCGRLWAIDSGMVDLFLNPRRRQCQPKLIAFSLVTDRSIGEHRFPDSLLTSESILVNLAVDVRDEHNNCHDTFVYVADVTSFSIIVFEARSHKTWKVTSNTMYPYPPFGVFRTNGVEFDLMDGVIGLALGPMLNGDRTLFYHSFASIRESWVPTSVLRNESIYSSGFNQAPRLFQASQEARTSQTAPQAFDKHGILYFGPVSENAIYCWNHQVPFTSKNIHQVAQDDVNLQFTTGLKVIQPENREEELWILTTRFQLLMAGRMSPNEVNFRVLKAKISDLIRGSACQQSGHNHGITFPNKSDVQKPYKRPGYGVF